MRLFIVVAALSVLASVCIWILDAAINAFLIRGGTFLDMLILDIPRYDLYFRLIALAILFLFGVAVSGMEARGRFLVWPEEQLRENMTKRFVMMCIGGDAREGISYISATVESVLGYKVDEVIGRPFQSFLPEPEAVKVDRAFAKALRGEKGVTHVREVLRKDGSRRDFEITSFPMSIEGKVVGFQGIVRDVTERKRVEVDIGILTRFSSENPNPMLSLSRDGTVLYANHSAQALLQEHKDIVGDLSSKFWQGLAAEASTTEENRIFELQLRDKVYSFLAVPLKKARHVNLFGLDITNQKRIEKELEKKVAERTRELEESQERILGLQQMATIGKMAAMVGHDLRNPLQVLATTLYLQKKRIKSLPIPARRLIKKKGISGLLQATQDQLRYMDKIVSDLQDYAKPVEPKLAETDVRKLINRTLKTISIPDNITVAVEIERNLDFSKINVDPYLMRRALTNLIVNAIQAMKKGGQLTIRAAEGKETTAISIQDTGVGIPERNLEKIFEPMFTTKSKGQGLGLSVCRQIVEAHQGRITVGSRVGEGTTFTIELPRSSGGEGR